MEGGGRRRGQATVEFAFVAPLFLLCFLGAVDAGLWALQNTAEVAAVETAARDAASAGASPLSRTAPDVATVTKTVANRLQQTLFATAIVPWCTGGARGCPSCPVTAKAVQDVFGPRVIAVCVQERDPPPCSTGVSTYCADTPMITVRITGFVASLVPPGFGVGAAGGELPTDVAATTHTLRFAP
jgi:Flp pilus assembly protein TadG